MKQVTFNCLCQECLAGGMNLRAYGPDKRFWFTSDLLVVDGGKPQLTAAIRQLAELGLDLFPICGLAKS